MDINESAEVKNSKITTFMEKNSLHDVHRTTVRDIPITTRLGSRSRIDFRFAMEGAFQMVRAAGYHALHKRINSDHVMLWADFDFKEFFGGGQAKSSSTQAHKFLM